MMARYALIPTTTPTLVGSELANIQDALASKNLSGQGKYTRLCEQWLSQYMGSGSRAILVSSCTSALEIAAILADIQPGDEVILPSYTYVSTANGFALRGAVPVFVNLDNTTMTLDVSLIESAITSKTRAIIPVHYGGVACDMDAVMRTASQHNLLVIEDAAMACTSTHHGCMLGTIGQLGCLSFQEKKNFTAAGQGGALLINDPQLVARADILYAHGTNRLAFQRGEVPRYEWLDIGINATLSEIQAAFLYAQLQAADQIVARRRHIWHRYADALAPLEDRGHLILPRVPTNTTHNANVFYIRVVDPARRSPLVDFLAGKGVQAHPQFMPLHRSPYGREHGRFVGPDRVTSLAAAQILLLPVHLDLSDEEQGVVISAVFAFWEETVQ
ncbi:TDP-4-keto-6-deoxy-D-glucose transaminase [Aspergillus campestris IBT 28561]|uniref:TDP-4-keto-6-deoxy-D-glucose transaminase n=1 Tax=Aspergillus campestris (strain IBT 28561) TaxID=1392248 RepID=A0A2I1CTW4_ASPC2|nr:TDP-4-keto-6-deoxy-D-glucose transaminase [Aspergillus campestris IBT 28561]PKY01054.1 TDP-4-keto-6-deoxy-D-glucose transaminase [Aspergillus campestris IBT 28561]